MGYIYKITNDINNKVYIGKTEFSIQKRFQEHCNDAFRNRNEKRPLYSAMRKYGIEHFHIELVEETNNTSEREIYWIKFYNSYSNGYNATLGGEGKTFYNHEEICKRLLEHPYPCDIAKEFNCSRDIISIIAKANNIPIKNKSQEELKLKTSKSISAYTKDNILVKKFNSLSDAARWCFENKKCAVLNQGVRSHISECAKGKRASAYGYIWKY